MSIGCAKVDRSDILKSGNTFYVVQFFVTSHNLLRQLHA
jgi:hypothetical protein